MTEKAKKDAETMQGRTRILIAVAVITAIFGVFYAICRGMGGVFADFADSAAPWVLYGIGLAGAMTYLSTKGKREDAAEDSE